MDVRFREYVVMSAVERIHGKRGRSSLVKLLRGSREYSVERMAHEYDLFSVWGLFCTMDKEEVEALISVYMEKGYLYTEEVQSGTYRFPMLHLSEEGRIRLSDLDTTERDKLLYEREQRWADCRALELSARGRDLEEFLRSLTSLLQLWEDGYHQGKDFTELLDEMGLDYMNRERMERFIFRLTPEKLQDHFRSRYVLDTTCGRILRQLRELLGALPELEALVFRWHFHLQDPLHRPLEEVMRYHGLMVRDVPGVLKRLISRFSNKSYLERFSFVQSVMEFWGDISDCPDNEGSQLVKDTMAVTYQLFTEGWDIPRIARERGLAVSTIYTHFIKLIPQYGIDLNKVIPKERLATILQAADHSGGMGLKAVKEQLASDYHYGEIKLVLELQKGWQAA